MITDDMDDGQKMDAAFRWARAIDNKRRADHELSKLEENLKPPPDIKTADAVKLAEREGGKVDAK